MTIKKVDTTESNAQNTTSDAKKTPICGIVMPISAIDGCSESHWAEVLSIFHDAIESVGFTPNLVSKTTESGIIQKTIVENLYHNEIVICDVSAQNPNVMLELGIRLAFDKPTILIKDHVTNFSFDTSTIQHLIYRRDLRFSNTVEFKQKLADTILNTYRKSQEDSTYSTFLKSYGDFTTVKITSKEVTENTYIIEQLKKMNESISNLKINQPQHSYLTSGFSDLNNNLQPSPEEVLKGFSKIKIKTGLISDDQVEKLNITFMNCEFIMNILITKTSGKSESNIQLKYCGEKTKMFILGQISLFTKIVSIEYI